MRIRKCMPIASVGMFFMAAGLLFLSAQAKGIDQVDTRMMSQPAISDKHIAFIYANDLWVANIDGTQPKRLTVDKGVEMRPFFSPDGKQIAFSAEYDGNTDVFLLPVTGGIPKRLTWHPGTDYASGFTVDGKSVLFLSQRALHTRRYLQLFTIPLEGGYPTQLEIPNPFMHAIRPMGQKWFTVRFRMLSGYGSTTVEEPSPGSGFSLLTTSLYQRFPSPREDATMCTPCGLVTKFISSATGTENLIFTRITQAVRM